MCIKYKSDQIGQSLYYLPRTSELHKTLQLYIALISRGCRKLKIRRQASLHVDIN